MITSKTFQFLGSNSWSHRGHDLIGIFNSVKLFNTFLQKKRQKRYFCILLIGATGKIF